MKHLLYLMLLLPALAIAQVTETDGDWDSHHETLTNTPEAELMVRTGDIDNLGFGWPAGFDPFSGNSTPAHAFPWTVDSLDPAGTDRIMVISSYAGTPPRGRDGYTSTTQRPDNAVRPITLTFDTDLNNTAATLQLFVDDFQAPNWGALYEVYLDSVRVPGLESIINALSQTGPIGKLITYQLPADLLYLLDDGSLSVRFDDFTTGAGDGYAVDFFKLLINPTGNNDRTATVRGTITNAADGSYLSGVVVSANNQPGDTTDIYGNYVIENLSPGINQLATHAPGFGAETRTIDVAQGQSVVADFQLVSPAPEVIYLSPSDEATEVDTASTIKMVFDQAIDVGTFNTASVLLTGGDRNISGTFGQSGDTMVFTPEGLAAGIQYQLTITTALKNTAGVRLERNTHATFTTAEASTALFGGSPGVPRFHIYPNPIRENTIYLSLPGAAASYQLCDYTGRVLQRGTTSPAIALSPHLGAGTYFLRILDRVGRPVGVARFVRM